MMVGVGLMQGQSMQFNLSTKSSRAQGLYQGPMPV